MGSQSYTASIHGIVKEHGGHIQLESSPETGTTFRLYFAAIQERPQVEEQAGIAVTGGDEVILVVEDDPNVRDIANQLLTGLSYTVHTAPNGSEGLHAFGRLSGSIDLVITDLVMPGMGGLELAQAIRAEDPEIPIILTTGYDSREHLRDEFKDHDIAIHLQKPFSLQDIAEAVRDACGA